MEYAASDDDFASAATSDDVGDERGRLQEISTEPTVYGEESLNSFHTELTDDYRPEEVAECAGKCPWCAYQSKAKDPEKQASNLQKHIDKQHADKVPAKTVGFEAEVAEVAGSTAEETRATREDQKKDIIAQIENLHANFPLGDVDRDLAEMDLAHLQRARARIMMKVQGLAANEAAFKLLQLSMALTEEAIFNFGKVDVRGAARDLEQPPAP